MRMYLGGQIIHAEWQFVFVMRQQCQNQYFVQYEYCHAIYHYFFNLRVLHFVMRQRFCKNLDCRRRMGIGFVQA